MWFAPASGSRGLLLIPLQKVILRWRFDYFMLKTALAMIFPHIVATEPSRSLRINPSMWMLLSKHRSSKLSKQVMNLPCVVKLARCVVTNLLQCNEMPARWFEVLLHPWTTQHILYLKKSDNQLNKRKSAKILSSNAAFQFICMKITVWSFPLASLTSLPLLAPSLMLHGRNMLD